MAIQRTLLGQSLVLEFNAGIVDGKQKLKRKNLSNIKENALDEKIYSTAYTLADLQELNLLHVKIKGTEELLES